MLSSRPNCFIGDQSCRYPIEYHIRMRPTVRKHPVLRPVSWVNRMHVHRPTRPRPVPVWGLLLGSSEPGGAPIESEHQPCKSGASSGMTERLGGTMFAQFGWRRAALAVVVTALAVWVFAGAACVLDLSGLFTSGVSSQGGAAARPLAFLRFTAIRSTPTNVTLSPCRKLSPPPTLGA